MDHVCVCLCVYVCVHVDSRLKYVYMLHVDTKKNKLANERNRI